MPYLPRKKIAAALRHELVVTVVGLFVSGAGVCKPDPKCRWWLDHSRDQSSRSASRRWPWSCWSCGWWGVRIASGVVWGDAGGQAGSTWPRCQLSAVLRADRHIQRWGPEMFKILIRHQAACYIGDLNNAHLNRGLLEYLVFRCSVSITYLARK